jgi:ABC-2 type transport system ATP-binding protein
MVHSVSAPSEITRALAQAALYLEELRRVTPDLESAFLAITEGEPQPFSGPDAAGGRA